MVSNDYIVTDPIVQALTTFLAASIYSVVLYTAYVTFLPTSLVTYFDNIPTIEAAHSSTYISLLPLTLFLGLAAKLSSLQLQPPLLLQQMQRTQLSTQLLRL